MNNEELKKLVHQAFVACNEKRPYEAQELFERVLPYITNSASKAATLYQLGFVNRSLLGNGLEARRFFLATVQTLKADATRTREYAWACENLMLLSLSYDEYASWAEDLRKLQPDEAILREQYPSVQKDRQKGLPWSDVLTGIAGGYYNRDPAKVDPGLYGEAAATYHVILANRRDLRLGREAWAQAVIEHVVLCIRLGNDTLNFAVKHRPLLNPLPYLAIGEAARGFIEEYLKSNPADARVNGMQTQLCSWRESLEEGARRLNAFSVRSEGIGAEGPRGSTSPAVRSALSIPLAFVTAIAKSFFGFLKSKSLVSAVRTDDVRCVRRLLDNGADPNQVEEGDDGLPLFYAVHSDIEIARLLIKHGAKINATCRGGQTALHIAASAGNVQMVELLLRHGANVDARDDRGTTPLHRATIDLSMSATLRRSLGLGPDEIERAEDAIRNAAASVLKAHGGTL